MLYSVPVHLLSAIPVLRLSPLFKLSVIIVQVHLLSFLYQFDAV